MQEPAAARADARTLVPDQRLVDAGAVDVAAQQIAAGVIFGDQRIAVVQQPRRRRAGRARPGQPAIRIVAQARRFSTGRAGQPILDIVGVGRGDPRRRVGAGGEIAVRVIAEGRGRRDGGLCGR
jgi:hypothetical protein